MKRQIIKIDEEKCNGCGICVTACHEGAIGMVDGKAKLLREDYCDGLGNCLPACPTGAITFEEREALEFNKDEVEKNMKAGVEEIPETLACGCPGTHARSLRQVPPHPKSRRPPLCRTAYTLPSLIPTAACSMPTRPATAKAP